jgi:hypothetical protein
MLQVKLIFEELAWKELATRLAMQSKITHNKQGGIDICRDGTGYEPMTRAHIILRQMFNI